MQIGISPDATQAAYRVGDSTTNIITPLMPYFALVVVFCQKYVKGAGIGTVVALMMPYSVGLPGRLERAVRHVPQPGAAARTRWLTRRDPPA